MALIKCRECGKEISSFANCCPNCGCPVTSDTVKIKIPNIELGTVGLFSSRKAIVRTNDGNVLWEGLHGQVASFQIDSETHITIDLGKWANSFDASVKPGKKYNCIQDTGIHWKATYRLSEVDVIDAD